MIPSQLYTRSVADSGAALVAVGTTALGGLIMNGATCGGRIVSDILSCMEVALNKKSGGYSRYGSTAHKQGYIYAGMPDGTILKLAPDGTRVATWSDTITARARRASDDGGGCRG